MKKVALSIMLAVTVANARPAPSFRGDLLEGGSVSLKEAVKPGRSLLVCFWASWCQPCMKELKLVKEMMANNKDLPLDVLTINEDTSETEADIRPMLKMNELDFPVILDPKQEIFNRYHRENALPYSVLIQSNGEIGVVFQGLHEEEMIPTIKKALAAQSTNAAK